MNLHRGLTNFYIQEYRDITLNTELEKLGHNQAKTSINPYFEQLGQKLHFFKTIFDHNQANLRMARNQKFQNFKLQPKIQLY